jgi:HPt (histidine-containing phosphotransfer) domain-containing protein
MPVGSHKDAFLAHQKVKKTFADSADNQLPKSAAQILLDFVKSQRQIVSENVPETIEISDIEKYDRRKVEEALHSVENLCGKCNENHDNNCFVNQARRVLIAMLTGVDVKEKFNGAQSLEELMKIAGEMKAEKESKQKEEPAAAQDGSPGIEDGSGAGTTGYEEVDKEFERLNSKIGRLKKDYFELKEKDIFRATLIDEVVDTIKSVAGGDFKNPMPVHEDDQLGKIAAAFNTMLETVNRTFKNLDDEVAKRSAELKLLMGNIKIGVFTMNKDFRINREYSKECLKIFGCEEIGGMNFFDLIQVYDKQAEKKEEIKNFIALYFNGFALDDDSMNSINPLFEHRLKEKYLQFLFYPVKTAAGGQTENMLVQCVDLTANKLLQMEIDSKDAEGRRIRKMVLNREAFNDFISETIKMADDARRISAGAIGPAELGELYRIAHTIKGGAGCFDLDELIAHTSGFEDLLGCLIKKGVSVDDGAGVAAGITNMLELVDKSIVYSEKIFGRPAVSAGEFEFVFKKSRLDELIMAARAASSPKVSPNLEAAFDSFYELPAHRVFAKSFAMVAPLAERLSKGVSLEVSGGDVPIPFAMSSKLSEIMLHLLRNAVDHAIETPEEREEARKPFEGLIKVAVSRAADSLELAVSDDGRGLDPVKISASAVEKGIIKPDTVSAMTDAEKTALIFKPGFSTKNEVSNISGRGVGMDVVKNAVEKHLNGILSVSSVPGAGTEFNIKIKTLKEV